MCLFSWDTVKKALKPFGTNVPRVVMETDHFFRCRSANTGVLICISLLAGEVADLGYPVIQGVSNTVLQTAKENSSVQRNKT